MLDVESDYLPVPEPPPPDDQGEFNPFREIDHLMATGDAHHATGTMAAYLSRYVEKTITLPDGEVIEVLARDIRADELSPVPWGLTENDSGTFDVALGTVLQGADDVKSTLTIGGTTTGIQPVAGQMLWLEVDSTSPTTGLLVTGVPWTGYSNPYETSGTGDTLTLVKYRFPLWRFYAADGVGNRQLLAEGVYGLQLCAENLKVINGAYKPTGEPILPVPVFEFASRAVPTV